MLNYSRIRHALFRIQYHDIQQLRLKTSPSKKYSATLQLPKTEFPLTIKDGITAQRETELQKQSSFSDLYQWQQKRDSNKVFTLHDGPPYANGNPHVGHVINKVLKDITNRFYVLQGYKVNYIPGWDCHGLPIELKAVSEKTASHLSPIQIRHRAKKFAEETIKKQSKSFQRWGVMADWETQCYYTFSSQYQVKQLELFYQMYEKGYIYQSFMPVFWSPSTKTALAEAELEYNPDHVSTAAYVRFPVISLPELNDLGNDVNLYLLIWTTTPWTLPANQAICYGPKLDYVVLRNMSTNEFYICGASCIEKLQALNGAQLEVISNIKGEDLKNGIYQHPLKPKEVLPLFPGDHVTADVGTGLVHTAPAHGHDDYKVAVDHNLDITCIVDGNGCYTSEIGPALEGKSVGTEADNAVLSLFEDHIIHSEPFTHNYPYDWRSKKPVIIRASKQWFVNTKKFHQSAVEVLKDIKILPASYEGRMEALLESRQYWCISRQRVWGVPIPVFYNRHTEEPLLNRATLDHIKSVILEQGSDAWWTLADDELLPQSVLNKIGKDVIADYVRGTDIMDIWFDSGSSWASVLPEGSQADVYMEGIDQFKGWFQSSLLTSIASTGQSPYKGLVVHGFTVDENGNKMSKSLGNVVDPDTVIHGGKNKQVEPAYGVDVLRLWAAHNNVQSQVRIGPSIIKQHNETFFELRKVLRLLLGNLFDFNIEETPIFYNDLLPQDKYMLYKLHKYGSKVTKLYKDFQYGKILFETEQFINVTLSQFYISITKDRLYCSSPQGHPRQSCQYTLHHILDVLNKCHAPILPHLAEEAYQYYPSRSEDSIFKTGWYHLPEEWNNTEIGHQMASVLSIKNILINTLITPVDFDLTIVCNEYMYSILKNFQKETVSSFSALSEILQTSVTKVIDTPPNISTDDVQVIQMLCPVYTKDGSEIQEKCTLIYSDALNNLCERCRRYTAIHSNRPCDRCLDAMSSGWE